jgi:hypothetical protein
MAQSTVRLLLQRIQAWNQAHPDRPIDPQAEFAVARMEGLSGGIGDGGHAFGPNQLNNAGGVLTGRFPGLSPQQIQQWAWSPQGIDYALAGVARAAGGERGARAVQDIVARFERPANPAREIQGALSALGVQPSGGMVQVGAPGASGVSGATVAQALSPAIQRQPVNPTPGLLQALSQTQGGDYSGFYRQLGHALQQPSQTTMRIPAVTLPAKPGQTVPAQTLPDTGGLKLTAVPLTLSTRNGIQVDQTILPAVLKVAQQFGVKVNSGYRSAQHNAQVGGAENSDHLRGDAVDFVGTPQQMRQLYQWAQGKFAYVEPWSQAGGNHVHISFQR